MKNSDKIKSCLIDEYYNEAQETVDGSLKDSDEYTEFKSKLNSTVKKMDVLNEDIFDFDIDILNIIEQGEYIKEGKKTKKEFILFILSSFIILSLYAIAIIKIGSKILIISQMLIVFLIPWIIIPISAIKRRGSEV